MMSEYYALPRRRRKYFSFYVLLLLAQLGFQSVIATTDDNDTDNDCKLQDGVCRAVPDTCKMVLAELSSDADDNNGEKSSSWGVFSLVPRQRGTPISKYGDIIIPITDNDDLLKDYTWDGDETGAHYEGHKSVRSVVPGLGMLANSVPEHQNLLPLAPRVDEGGLTRFESPGSGAITHYHNYTLYILQNVEEGGELFWSDNLLPSARKSIKSSNKPTLDELKQNGYCLDNLRPGQSRIKEAGRGAFATRELLKGSIVAPVPVLPIQRSDLGQQLLRNYCLGSKNSSVLLYPYGPMVNLINHFTEPNVRFQWKSNDDVLEHPNPNTPLFMELVATRDIQEGEEIYLDYGRDWEDAWWQHAGKWEASDFHYTPSYVMDDVIKMLRTEKELKDHPYPDNLFTSCFYRYSDRADDEKMSQPESSNSVTSFQWKLTKRLYDLRNLRPCQVLKRNEASKGRSAYAVRMFNRPGLPAEEQIPKGELHIVTHVPRSAIRFSDKAGTTDMHLPYAFRHEIGLPIFPESWLDKKEEASDQGFSF